MNQHYWQGEWIDDAGLIKKTENLQNFILQGHQAQFNIDEFYRACDRMAKKLQFDQELLARLQIELTRAGEISLDDARAAIAEISDFLKESKFRAKVSAEFGMANPFRSERVLYDRPVFESWFPLGFLVQILAGNSPSLAVLSAFEGLVTGNINFIKLSSGASLFTALIFEEFFKDPVANTWKNLLIITHISSNEKIILAKVISEADGVVAWGGEESLAQIRELTPTRARLIEWGHRISFSYISQKALANSSSHKDLPTQIAEDLFKYDQQACSSPQCLFVEDASFSQLQKFADQLQTAFEKKSSSLILPKPSEHEAAEITKTVLVTKVEAALHKDFTEVRESSIAPGLSPWRILIDNRPGLRASPLYRTLWLKPLRRTEILKTLRPLGQYLQTVGLRCEREELTELAQSFFKAGVSRIRPMGAMLESYSGEPHDGVPALTRYMKKVSLEQDCNIENFATLDDLQARRINFSKWPMAIMTKDDFQNMSVPADSADLFFKSGGSSGEAKLSVFTYRDYHQQMRLAADGLVAAGLEPANDKCMNLFFGGGLYGGFLSFFTILEDLKAVQFPMSAHMDFEFVGKTIVENKVNVLLGMPSYLLQLFSANHDRFSKYKGVQKIFFGGEHFSQSQRQKLIADYGVRTVLSASYGSVDMGPLGYQCSHSSPGVHHLHQHLHHLEILGLDSDQPVSSGQTGRLVFSTNSRQGLQLLRYDLGDIGSWVDGACLCGRLSPRFELKGRSGDIFKASGSFLNFNQFIKTLSDQLNYSMEAQLIITNIKGRDHLNLVVDRLADLDGSTVRKALLQNYPDLQETVEMEKLLDFAVSEVSASEFQRAPGSGKLRRVIDQRII
jgi:phenylacetate-coenzyme A ligase PaaK-like adenylate-forming protein